MDNVRPKDLTIQVRNSEDWVLPKSGGISCFDRATPGKTREWKLPKGTAYSDDLYLRDDQNGHWTWEPAVDMKLDDYKTLLRTLGRNFA